jgi:hypothetical protein
VAPGAGTIGVRRSPSLSVCRRSSTYRMSGSCPTLASSCPSRTHPPRSTRRRSSAQCSLWSTIWPPRWPALPHPNGPFCAHRPQWTRDPHAAKYSAGPRRAFCAKRSIPSCTQFPFCMLTAHAVTLRSASGSDSCARRRCHDAPAAFGINVTTGWRRADLCVRPRALTGAQLAFCLLPACHNGMAAAHARRPCPPVYRLATYALQGLVPRLFWKSLNRVVIAPPPPKTRYFSGSSLPY